MAVLKCKMCGGDLNVTADEKIVECEFCGTTQTVPDGSDEKKTNLFNRANRLRMDNEFDKAAGVYESIVSEFPEEAEGYWGLVLCSYGIEYVDDAKTGKKIPTCHRTLTSSVMDNDNFVQACENADSVARGVYREEAKAIDRLQQQIIAVVENEEPYDVFICYKETDDITKSRTEDSLIAQDIYTELIKEGYKVFFSRVTLRDKAGTEYEPYIYAALKSAKIMLAIGTKFDYYDAVWVKNEWSRYISMMADDSAKHLIPCFKNLDAYDIPKEFKNLQALDMGEVTFFKNLMDNVARLVPKQKEAHPNTIDTAVPATANTNVDSLLKRAFMFLEDGNWGSANEYCEKVLDINPECAEAYLGKLMAETKCSKVADIGSSIMESKVSIGSGKYIIENCIDKLALIKYVREILGLGLKEAKEFVEQKSVIMDIPDAYLNDFKNICNLTLSARTVADINSPIRANKNYEKFIRFASKERADEINSYIASWEQKKRNKELEDLYEKAVNLLNTATTEEELKEAISIFESISGYKDSDSLLEECEKELPKIQQRLQEKKEKERLNKLYASALQKMNTASTDKMLLQAAELFDEISSYKDSKQQAEKARAKADAFKKDLIYNQAIRLMNENDITSVENAIKKFGFIPGWKDANDKIYACQKKIEEIKEKAEQVRLAREKQAEAEKARKEQERIEKEKQEQAEREEKAKIAKRNKRIVIIVSPIVVAVIIFVIVLNSVIIPAQKKNEFISLYGQNIYDRFGIIEIGKSITFGKYEQDNDNSNGKEDIEWLVLEMTDEKILAISKYALDCKQYNANNTDVTWETCTLREWLNSDFINTAFSTDEKSMIPTVTVLADENPGWSTELGNATQDQVFLLSIPEANKYFTSDSERQCKPTDYAVANGAIVPTSAGNCIWWLRTPGEDQVHAATVFGGGTQMVNGTTIPDDGGGIVNGGCRVDSDEISIRPAMWIDLK